MMEADVEGLIGAGRFERSAEPATWCNGYRDRTLDTRLGSFNRASRDCGPAAISRLPGAQSSEKALVAVIQEAWIAGVSTGGSTISSRRWIAGITKSPVSSSARTSTSG